jgi:hypothetical protein
MWSACCETPASATTPSRSCARSPLCLPGFARPAAAQPAATQPAMTPRDAIRRLPTWQHDERTHLLVFTSPQALRQQLTGAVDGWRLTDVTGLVGARPDPEYGIAINPNAPIGACLNADELTALAGLVASAPVFHPATAAEAVMLDAINGARPATYLDALMHSPALLERGTRREPSSSADLPRVKQGQYALGARPACSLQKSCTLI